jgi:DNA helicase II / ATP-dependent DNA helicase PcrA
MTPSHKNLVIVASAGSRKTTRLVTEALALPDKRILITTFTNENLAQITKYFCDACGVVPANVTLTTWYSLLLQHGVRPYQNRLTPGPRIRGMVFEAIPAQRRRIPKANPAAYYVSSGSNIFKDRTAEFVVDVNSRSKGLPIARLGRLYDHVFVDELQDLNGYDLELLDLLFASSMNVVAVGDPRQATFRTNRSAKNRQYSGSAVMEWLTDRLKRGVITITEVTECYRSNQAICDLADSLYPNMPRSKSMQLQQTGHDGVFEITRGEVASYVAAHMPTVLRYDRRSNTCGLAARNIGSSKGLTFERVLVFPTQPMLDFLRSRDPEVAGARSKMYVAVTRAKFSVAFVTD